jgi:hypothetical protein
MWHGQKMEDFRTDCSMFDDCMLCVYPPQGNQSTDYKRADAQGPEVALLGKAGIQKTITGTSSV